ncbi:MAG TPA: cyclopropane-fatty-acyl-phospholipid synthase family protein [Kofleriaceae bacterium]|nr:cyclopropane-fatty-acyl-phospholipid synthase family protein [Kofleriaceae bacterium]
MKLSDYVTFNDKRLARRYADAPIKMSHLYEAYFDGDIDIPGDIFGLLRNRNAFVEFKLTWQHLRWAVTNFVWEASIHSKKQDTRIVREHYDRGNDFFGWFLGERMVYTSGFFEQPGESLEEAQDNKMNLVCQKLKLAPGDRMLDIGCGWGTLARHAARYYGVDATGVTLSKEQTSFANQRMADWGVQERARVLCLDYRDSPQEKYDKIVSLEMVEHVGVKNLKKFYTLVNDRLADDGIFVLQWTGLRRGLRPEDLIWGLFMNKYVFPGADASLCPSRMLKVMEKAGFEFHSIENLTIHYSWTIQRWFDNWVSNKDAILAAYGERWFRIWKFFLAWSVIIGEQGNAACFQVVANKNLDQYKRQRWILDKGPVLGDRAGLLEAPSRPMRPPLVEVPQPRPLAAAD